MCDVTGHVVVVHLGSNPSVRIACGVCYESCTASIKDYPNSLFEGKKRGQLTSVAGSVSVSGPQGSSSMMSKLALDYSLTGVQPASQAGLHIHTGVTCDAEGTYPAYNVAGHFYATAADPWLTKTFSADFSGAASGKIEDVMAGLSFPDVVGHAVVVHDGDGSRIGCGICVKTTECTPRDNTCSAKIGTYPGYNGDLQNNGKVQVFEPQILVSDTRVESV